MDTKEAGSSDVPFLPNFTPESLTSEQWQVARGPVLAAVAGVPGLPVSRRKTFVSVLCKFLAVSGWSVGLEPDLAALLTSAKIEALVTSSVWPGLSEKTLADHRTSLRRVGRSLGSIEPWPPNRTKTPITPSCRFWRAVAGVPAPFTVTSAAFTAAGRRVHPTMWGAFGADLAAGADILAVLAPSWASPVPDPATGLSEQISSVRDAAAALHAAVTVDLMVVSAMTTSDRSPKRTASPTRRAAAARAAMKAAQAPPLPSVVPQAQLPALPADVEAAIAVFTPRGQLLVAWDLIADACRYALRAYGPTTPRWVSTQGGQVAAFVGWAAHRHGPVVDPVDVGVVVEPGLVDAYVAGKLAHRPDASRATTRSLLRRVVRRLTGGDKARIGYKPVQEPYGAGECAGFVRVARNQPTSDRRRALSALVALGAGAGLDGADQRFVTPDDVQWVTLPDRQQRVLMVRVRGPRPRTVVVRSEYEQLLDEAVQLHVAAGRGRGVPLHGRSLTRSNVTSSVVEKAVTATGQRVNISAARLRATWLIACMNAAVPLSVLLPAAGLKSARTLTDLLTYCPAPNPDAVAVLLRDLDVSAQRGDR